VRQQAANDANNVAFNGTALKEKEVMINEKLMS
jgi:hypothetical protein